MQGLDITDTVSIHDGGSAEVSTIGTDDDDLDKLIRKLLGARKKVRRSSVTLTDGEVLGVIEKAKVVLLRDPMLLEIHAPLKVCGDLHGQFHDLLRIFDHGGYPPESSYLFMGDYVDRGRHSIETMCLLLAYKVKYPDRVYLLRGNHESTSVNRIYGFYEEILRKHCNASMWMAFNACFNCLPVAAIVSRKIFCCHGGLSPELHMVSQISLLPRSGPVPSEGLMCDLLWSDPDMSVQHWGPNRERGISWVFSPEEVKSFLHRNNLEMMCRGHQMTEHGYEFFADRQLVTIFSAPNYCGTFTNKGAFMSIDITLTCTFQVI